MTFRIPITLKIFALATGLSSLASGAVIHVVPDMPLVPPRGNGTEFLPLDLDGDGVDDFQIINDGSATDVRTLGDNRVLGLLNMATRVRGLDSGVFIGEIEPPTTVWTESFFFDPPFQFVEVLPIIISCSAPAGGGTACRGDFVGTTALAGVEFDIGGQTHYGWFRVRAGEISTNIQILDWAYESEPGVSIRAGAIPEPSGGVLALIGSLVLLGRRRG